MSSEEQKRIMKEQEDRLRERMRANKGIGAKKTALGSIKAPPSTYFDSGDYGMSKKTGFKTVIANNPAKKDDEE